MEPEGSLLHSQELAASPYSEPDQSSSFPHPTYWRFILILSSYLRLDLESGRIHVQAQNNFPDSERTCIVISTLTFEVYACCPLIVLIIFAWFSQLRRSFPMWHWPTGLSDGDAVWFLCGRKCIS